MKAEHWLKKIADVCVGVCFLSTIPEDMEFATSEEFLKYVEDNPDEVIMLKNVASEKKVS